MTIHHAIIKKAEKMGVSLSEDRETETVVAHWVERNVFTAGIGGFGKAAMLQMEALHEIATKLGPEFRIKNDGDDKFTVRVFNNDLSRTLDREPLIPVDALMVLNQMGDKPWPTTSVPEDGAQAYAEGWTAADCPYPEPDEESDEEPDGNFEAWNEAFDAAADAAQEAEDEEPTGSVVKPEYRMRYAEAGHPNHCGDWLADTLNNLILGKTHTDIDNFEDLCNANNVSLAKYKREGNGWQGRLRMTGRNLLAKQVFLADGVMNITKTLQALTDGNATLRAPGEWMTAQRFKGKKAPEAAIPATTVAEPAAPTPDAPAPEQPTDDVLATEQPPYDAAAPAPDPVPSVSEQLARRRASSKNKR